MGIPRCEKGINGMDLESNSFLVSMDVSFREKVFPFEGLLSDPHNLFLPDVVDMTNTEHPTKQATNIGSQVVDQLSVVDHVVN